MIKNGITYNKFYLNGVEYNKGFRNNVQIFGDTSVGYRYIRDYTNGNNNGFVGFESKADWVEIKAHLADNTNVALNKPVTTSGTILLHTLDRITNNNTYFEDFVSIGNNLIYVQIDLGQIYDIKKLHIWRYYNDPGAGRTYLGTKTQVSKDGINWITVFDSAVSGTYVETSAGKEILIP